MELLRGVFRATGRVKLLHVFALVLALLMGRTAQAVGFWTFGMNLGQLTWTVSHPSYGCVDSNGIFHNVGDARFSNFTYTPYQGSGQSLGTDTVDYISGSPDDPNCPPNGPTGTLTFYEAAYTISFNPTSSNGDGQATIWVPGYINPKYVVVAVVYAPPGSNSYVDYANSTLVSSTNTVTNTFIDSVDQTVTLTGPGGLFGFLGGTRTTTYSNTLTQQNQDSKSVTSSYTNTQSLRLHGPGPMNNCGAAASDFIGVDHDCDLIKLWVNPVMLFTPTSSPSGNAVEWNGYGSSDLDTVAPIHVVDILVGCLNGDIAPGDSRCAPPLQELQRTWAANENWPSGEGPGLTQTDLNDILQADPWGQCTPSAPIGSNACPTYSTPGFVLLPPQFTISALQNVPFSQGAPQTGWTVSTTSSTTQGQESMTAHSQTFGFEDAFKGSSYLNGLGASVKVSQTLTTKHEVNNQTTTSNTFTGMANITGPACNGNPCNPTYPPSPQTYGEATEFDIFVDNFFGTFVFVPSAYN